VRPHFPLTAPPEFYALYDEQRMPMPRLYHEAERPQHPAVQALKSVMNYDDFFPDERAVRRAIASYYALVSFLDDNIRKILAALDAAGLSASTRVIYTSDHGDNLGSRGLWGKSVMYEESVAVPLVMAGADIPAGQVVETPVSLVDCYRTVLETVGCPVSEDDLALPSRSLWEVLAGRVPDRNVLSEYHAAGSITGTFMIRHGRWKYIHHVGFRPELYDLEADPGETTDLAERPDTAPVLAECRAALLRICDPDAVTTEAFADQRRRIALHGGRDAVMQRGDYGYTPGEEPARVVR
jgi:choline-sulfatase